MYTFENCEEGQYFINEFKGQACPLNSLPKVILRSNLITKEKTVKVSKITSLEYKVRTELSVELIVNFFEDKVLQDRGLIVLLKDKGNNTFTHEILSINNSTSIDPNALANGIALALYEGKASNILLMEYTSSVLTFDSQFLQSTLGFDCELKTPLPLKDRYSEVEFETVVDGDRLPLNKLTKNFLLGEALTTESKIVFEGKASAFQKHFVNKFMSEHLDGHIIAHTVNGQKEIKTSIDLDRIPKESVYYFMLYTHDVRNSLTDRDKSEIILAYEKAKEYFIQTAKI